MKITRALLSLLYSLVISWGFSPDTWTRRRHDRQPYSFQRARHHLANANQLVYFAATKNNSRMEHLNDNQFHRESERTAITKASKRATASSKIASGSSSAGKQQPDEGSVLKSKQKDSKPGQVRAKITEGDVHEDNNLFQMRWDARFNQLIEYKQQYGDCLVPYELEENPPLGRWVDKQRGRYKQEPKTISEERIQRLEEIGFEWDALKAQWELRFWHLVEYKRQYGDCLVPFEFEDNRQLGQWVEYQRQRYKRVPNLMSKNHIQRLEELGFEWDPLKAQWESRFLQLVKYKRQHGDCLVPSGFQENPQLGTWVDNQRQRYKREPKTIPDDQIQRLEDIGFEWDPHKAQWELRFQQLVEYKQQHGDCLVSCDLEENCQLGTWVSTQRSCYNKRVPKDEISKDRIRRLEEIGFEWDALKALWELRFQQLVRYKQQHGDCFVPSKFKENPQLGKWVSKQRQGYKRVPKAISNNRIERLEAIGFEWTGRRLRWDETM